MPSTIRGSDNFDTAQRLTLGTSQASTSGTAIDFTSIPSWVKRITVNFVGVSTNGTSNIIVQLGTSSGIETSGYSGASIVPAVVTTNWTSGIIVTASTGAPESWHGQVVICLAGGTNWTAAVNIARSTGVYTGQGAGSKSLAAVLDRLRITTANGTDAFDLGSINILYE